MTRVDESRESDLVERLRDAGCVYADDEAALLRATATSPRDLENLTAQRVAGQPLEHVLGWAEFAGLRIVVEPDVFVPRRRTELLVRIAAELVQPGHIVVDVCCGSGAVAAAVAATTHDIEVHGSDIDPVAVRCARRNLPTDHVHQGDLLDALPLELQGRVDLIAANAPYVPTDEITTMPTEARDYEPRSALDGGEDGLDVHRRLAAQAPEWLAPNGRLILETSDQQANETARILSNAGLVTSTLYDDDLDATAVIGLMTP